MSKGLRKRWGVYVTNVKNKDAVVKIIQDFTKVSSEEVNQALGYNNPCVYLDHNKVVALQLVKLIIAAGADSDIKRVMAAKTRLGE